MNNPFDWLQLGLAGAALLSMVLLVRFVVTRIQAMQTEVLTFIGNHMSKSTGALEGVVTNLALLNERVDVLHDDNVETARVLSAADKTTTRKVAVRKPRAPAKATT